MIGIGGTMKDHPMNALGWNGMELSSEERCLFG